MLINGKHLDKDDKIEVLNPFNNQIIDTVPSGSQSDMKMAIESAYNAKTIIKAMSSRKISRIMYDIYNDILKNSKPLAELLTLETGKPIMDSLGEIQRSVETLLLAAEEAKRIYGETVPLDACVGGKTAIGFTIKEPLGVIAAITPFNYPVNLAVHKIAPAIAAKNTVVLKPSKKAPLTALKFTAIMDRHLPDGVLNVVTGHSSIIGDEMVSSPFIDKISFTGSVKTGKEISKKSVMKKLTMELGGNDPLIVLEDADIDEAVTATVKGAFLYAGQVCIAVKRVIVHDKIADEYIDKLKSATNELNIGDPMNNKTNVGPLIDEEAAMKVEDLVEDSIKNGAELVIGGKRDCAFYIPTILDRVDPEMKIVSDETFGPIAPIIRVSNLDEALKIANNTHYGLQAGIFTESIEKALKAAQSIEAGSVIINRQSTFRTDNMPFGGFKSSGMGKEGVKYAIEDMVKTKLIVFG